MTNVIEIKKLKKEYPNFTLDIDNLAIPSGYIIGLIGENGAGKTTLIKSILNIIKTTGTIKIFNKDHLKEENIIKEDIGVVLDNSFFPELLTPKNINSIMQDIYQNWDKALFYNYLKDFNILDTQQLKQMSKGMRKKVEIAVTLSHHPKLLILDEATSGLDPIVRNEVLEIFQNFMEDESHSIIMSTHITSDLEHIADQIIFINQGEIVFNKSHEEIINNYGIIKCDEQQFLSLNKEDIVSYKKHKYNYEVLISNLKKCQKKYSQLVIEKITLEELMLLIIKGEK